MLFSSAASCASLTFSSSHLLTANFSSSILHLQSLLFCSLLILAIFLSSINFQILSDIHLSLLEPLLLPKTASAVSEMARENQPHCSMMGVAVPQASLTLYISLWMSHYSSACPLRKGFFTLCTFLSFNLMMVQSYICSSVGATV